MYILASATILGTWKCEFQSTVLDEIRTKFRELSETSYPRLWFHVLDDKPFPGAIVKSGVRRVRHAAALLSSMTSMAVVELHSLDDLGELLEAA